MGIELRTGGGIAEVVIDFPPVNALPVQGWFDLAGASPRAGADPAVRAVILAAEGRGFNAGVDIKEMQRDPGPRGALGANRGCFAAFAAVYECAVPVIAAVHGFCLGGGVGLAGNADIVDRVRRRHLRPARGRPRRARRGDAPRPAGAAAPDARHGLHLPHRHRAAAARLRLRARRRRRQRSCGRPPGPWPARSPPRTRPSSGRPSSRSTASTRSTSSAATGTSRASPSSSTSPAWRTRRARPFVDGQRDGAGVQR